MINAFGPVYGYLGYQVHTRKFFQALNKLTPICLSPAQPNYWKEAVPADVHEMIGRQKNVRFTDPAIYLGYGNEFHRFNGGYRIGFTVFEYTKLQDDWLNGMRQVDEVWTTSRWGAEIVKKHGIAVPVEAVPEGFDPLVFNPRLHTQKKDDGIFRFISVGKWEARKGQVELLKAWATRFRGVKDVELILMCNNPFLPNFSLENEIKKLDFGSMPPIKFIKDIPSDTEMAKYYAAADCFVLPTRGEGWGLTIMEAMASGLPVITTRYSAITDYATDENAYLLDVKRMVPVYDLPFFPNAGQFGEWAEIDGEQLAEHLWTAYSRRDEAKKKGLIAGKDMLRQWTWDHAAAKAFSILKQRGLVT